MYIENLTFYKMRVTNTVSDYLEKGFKACDIIAELNLTADEIGDSRLTPEQEKGVISWWESILRNHKPKNQTKGRNTPEVFNDNHNSAKIHGVLPKRTAVEQQSCSQETKAEHQKGACGNCR